VGGGAYNAAALLIDMLTGLHGNKADVFADCFGCP
jgi:hypothetical protein